jgi:hypothetical protein
MGEMSPQFPVLMQVSNDERHDAALTIAELSGYDAAATCQVLEMVGLAARDSVQRLRPDGGDEYELSWFTPRVRPASAQ